MVVISCMYIPQPLLPLLATHLNTSPNNASLIISITLMPMAIAPLVYGYALENIQPKKVLLISLFGVGILQIALSFCNVLSVFLALRFIQSLCFPAILTTLLTILTRLKGGKLQLNISIYVASTITGGLLGRVIGGILTDIFSWEACFIFLGACVLISVILVILWLEIPHYKLSKIKLNQLLPLLQNKKMIAVMVSVFIMFFCFQAVLNNLPFVALHINPQISHSELGRLYIGYSMGILVSIFATRITKWFGSRRLCITIGFVICGGVIVFLLDSMISLYVGIFILCAGSFITHTVLSAYNSTIGTNKGVTNGLYLSSYYLGGTCGSYLASFLFTHFGWHIFVIFISLLSLIGGAFFYFNTRHR